MTGTASLLPFLCKGQAFMTHHSRSCLDAQYSQQVGQLHAIMMASSAAHQLQARLSSSDTRLQLVLNRRTVQGSQLQQAHSQAIESAECDKAALAQRDGSQRSGVDGWSITGHVYIRTIMS